MACRTHGWRHGVLIALFGAGACTPSRGVEAIKKPPPPATPTPGGTPSAPTPLPTPTVAPNGAGTLRLDGFEALGRAGENGISGGGDILVGVNGALGILPIPLSGDIGLGLTVSNEASVGCVLGLGGWGIALQAKNRTTTASFFKKGATDLALLAPDGRIMPLVPDATFAGLELGQGCDVALQASSDGFLYALETGRTSLWKFSLQDLTGTRQLSLPAGHALDRFIPLSAGHVLYSTVDAGWQRHTWWRNGEGVVTSLQYPNVDVTQTKSLGATALTFAAGGRSGAMMLTPASSGIVRSFLEPLYGLNGMTYWGAATRTTVGDWMVTGYTALNAKEKKIASNPFWRSYGRFQGLVDASEQVYFDGSNLVTVSNDAGLKVRHHKNIVQNALKRWKVIAVFGPAQGFTDRWVGFASDEGFLPPGETNHMYWVEIDPVTGRVDDEKVYRMRAPNMYPAWTSVDLIPEFTPYRVPGPGSTFRLVGLGGTWKAGLFPLEFDEAQKVVTLGTQLGCAYTYEHARALLHEKRLLFTASWYNTNSLNDNDDTNGGCTDSNVPASKYVHFYDGETGTASHEGNRIALPGELNANFTPPLGGRNNCNAHLAYGLIRMPGRTGPSAIICDVANQDMSQAEEVRTAPLRLVHFSDFTFASATANFPLPVRVGMSSDTYGDFHTGVVNNVNWMQSYALPNDVLTLGLGLSRVVKVVNTATGAPLATIPFNELWTENRFEYSRIFGHMTNTSWAANEVDVVAPWDQTRFFASDDTDAGYRSYLVHVEQRSFVPITALDGLQVLSAARVDTDRVLVSALQGSTALTVLLDNDGNVMKQDESDFLVREVAPILREP